MRLLRITAAVGLLLLIGLPLLARDNHAILIGASKYENLPEQAWLNGPKNDVDLVAIYLLNESPVPFAQGNVKILADGLEGSTAPTLAAIRGAFVDLEAVLAPGDFVYLHFAGHGTQMPARDPSSEQDGLDEAFLPTDIGQWDDGTAFVENALVDDEIGELIAGLRAKGATVWAVFDSCHSGTVTRGAPTGDDDVRTRKLDANLLGIPQDALIAAEKTSRGAPDARVRKDPPVLADEGGGFVAFFAAQTNEVTEERLLPRKLGAEKRVQGVFTYTLFEIIAANPGITYRQLSQEVLRRYSVTNVTATTPMFEGDLDAFVFSGEEHERISQWPVAVTEYGLTIPAGGLHGLGEGAVLALVKAPTDKAEAILGYFEAVYAEPFLSEFESVEHGETQALSLADVPEGAYLRKLDQAVEYTVTVALPDNVPGDVSALVAEAVAQIQADGVLGPRVIFVDAGETADIRLAILPDSTRPDAVWMLPASGLKAQVSPSIGTADKTMLAFAEVFADNLAHMSRALNLLKIGGAYGSDGEIDVDVELLTKNRRNRKLRPLDADNVPLMVPGDELHLLATNNMDYPVDINVLYVGNDFSISHMKAERVLPGDALPLGIARINDKSLGRDHLVVILTPAKPQTVVANMNFMQQDSLNATRDANEKAGRVGLAGALAEAGFGHTTRSAVSLDDESTGPAGAILQFEIDTVAAH